MVGLVFAVLLFSEVRLVELGPEVFVIESTSRLIYRIKITYIFFSGKLRRSQNISLEGNYEYMYGKQWCILILKDGAFVFGKTFYVHLTSRNECHKHG